MKYWQNEETGMCCAVENQPSLRHYEISKEAYEAHDGGITTGAVDVRRAFVEGAKWWEYHKEGATMWQSDQRLAEVAAEVKYPDSNTVFAKDV